MWWPEPLWEDLGVFRSNFTHRSPNHFLPLELIEKACTPHSGGFSCLLFCTSSLTCSPQFYLTAFALSPKAPVPIPVHTCLPASAYPENHFKHACLGPHAWCGTWCLAHTMPSCCSWSFNCFRLNLLLPPHILHGWRGGHGCSLVGKLAWHACPRHMLSLFPQKLLLCLRPGILTVWWWSMGVLGSCCIMAGMACWLTSRRTAWRRTAPDRPRKVPRRTPPEPSSPPACLLPAWRMLNSIWNHLCVYFHFLSLLSF